MIALATVAATCLVSLPVRSDMIFDQKILELQTDGGYIEPGMLVDDAPIGREGFGTRDDKSMSPALPYKIDPVLPDYQLPRYLDLPNSGNGMQSAPSPSTSSWNRTALETCRDASEILMLDTGQLSICNAAETPSTVTIVENGTRRRLEFDGSGLRVIGITVGAVPTAIIEVGLHPKQYDLMLKGRYLLETVGEVVEITAFEP